MSKSYKKHPVIKQEKVDKRLYNRLVRHSKLDYSLKGGQYKKLNSDANWKYEWTLNEAIANFKPSSNFTTLDSWIQYWYKCCVRK